MTNEKNNQKELLTIQQAMIADKVMPIINMMIDNEDVDNDELKYENLLGKTITVIGRDGSVDVVLKEVNNNDQILTTLTPRHLEFTSEDDSIVVDIRDNNDFDDLLFKDVFNNKEE